MSEAVYFNNNIMLRNLLLLAKGVENSHGGEIRDHPRGHEANGGFIVGVRAWDLGLRWSVFSRSRAP